MNNNNTDSRQFNHPELNSLNQELELIDLAVSSHAKPYGYIEAGEALNKVQEQELFKQLYNSFNEFCLDRYKFQAEQGYKLIRASNVANLLKNKGFSELPEIESHARCFTKLLRQNQLDTIVAIWLELTSSGKTITAKRIKGFIYKYTKGFGVPVISTNSPKSGAKRSNRFPIDLQGKSEKRQPLSQIFESPIDQTTPTHQSSKPKHQLIEKLTAELRQEQRKNKELYDVLLNITSIVAKTVDKVCSIDETVETVLTNKD